MAMSMYPPESEPLYSRYATKVAAHTIQFYSDYLFPYPYPKVLVVEAGMGMEYPMLGFTYGRPGTEGAYSEWLKRAMISVVIHEVGHNYFPMVVNSDERQWAWMDEGLNSFVQYLAEQAWEKDYPSRRGPPEKVVRYMQGPRNTMVPIMTNPEQLKQKGNNAYLKAATALNILRETIMGRSLFDYAFRTYCRRWAFKHPTPADFFRTMEDASAVDLDWFWKGWFYTTDPVDIELANVTLYKYAGAPGTKRGEQRSGNKAGRRKGSGGHGDAQSTDDMAVFKTFDMLFAEEDPSEKAHWNFYEVHLRNKGGLVMPVLLEFRFADGDSEFRHIPAEIWRYNPREVRKVFAFPRQLKSLHLDPNGETADINQSNNHFTVSAKD
jgi:hypothetical protein